MEGSWIIFILVNIVLALVVNIVGNVATPWVKSLIDKSIFSSRQKRIVSLIKEYQKLKTYSDNTSLFVARLVELIFVGLVDIASMAVTLTLLLFIRMPALFSNYSLAELIIMAMFGFYMLAMYLAVLLALTLINNVRNFDKYKEKTIAKIKKLGGNPEDLDKEETEGG